ncbi:hypothetical protein OMCYN_01445 [cyanobiont of Ornithocercus magnificus]|nr:hypothetical protein OMCYN_01445 [cyanobiont of Ornithocercus magnificus]
MQETAVFIQAWLSALAVNALLITLCQRLPLLTPAGWVHAGILGTILWGSLGWRGWFAVVLYLILGSIVTRLGLREKTYAGIAEARGGQRAAANVWGSAATGAALAMLIAAGVQPTQALRLGFAASFAAKLADTCGSEIGKRWGHTTVLITTLQPVPAGTEGAISLEGTLASIFGSIVMTFIMSTLLPFGGLLSCTTVALSGLIATLFESLIGATLQRHVSWLNNELVNALQTTAAALLAMALALLSR